jgi:hypothetical protein
LPRHLSSSHQLLAGPKRHRHRLAGGKRRRIALWTCLDEKDKLLLCSREKITGGVNSASRAMKLILA